MRAGFSIIVAFTAIVSSSYGACAQVVPDPPAYMANDPSYGGWYIFRFSGPHCAEYNILSAEFGAATDVSAFDASPDGQAWSAVSNFLNGAAIGAGFRDLGSQLKAISMLDKICKERPGIYLKDAVTMLAPAAKNCPTQ